MNRIIDNTFRGIKRNMYICCDIKKIFDFDYKKMRKIIYILIYIFVSYSFLFEGFQSVYANQNDEMVTVTLYSNYPVDCGMEDTTQTTSGYYEVSLSMNSNGLTCDGYTFLGWNEDKDDAEFNVQYNSYDIISFNKTTNLYACWRKNITITYDAGEGRFSDNSRYKYLNTYVGSYKSISLSKPKLDGSYFIGWYVPGISIEGDVDTYISNNNAQTYSYNCSESITLIAKYSSNIKTITFESNGGYFGSDKTQVTKSYQVVPEISFYDCVGTPASPNWPEEDKGFLGWMEKGDPNEKVYSSPGVGTFKFSENKTYVAVYGDYYTVTFKAGDGYFKSGENKIESTNKKVITGGYFYSSDVPTTYNDDSGMFFAGWKIIGSDDNNLYTKNEISGNEHRIKSDMTYEAVWLDSNDPSQMEGYVSVSFDAGEGWLKNLTSGIHSEKYIIPKGKSLYSFRDSGISAYREGYSLQYWTIKGDASGKTYSSYNAANYKTENDVTFVATWSNVYMVTFDLGEEYYRYINDRQIISTEISDGSPAYFYFSNSGMEQTMIQYEDMFVTGWKCSLDGKIYKYYSRTILLDEQTGEYYSVKEDVTFTAVWEKGYKIIFSSPEGLIKTYNEGNPYKYTAYAPPGYPLAVVFSRSGSSNYMIPSVSSKEGSVFKGWKIDGQNSSIVYIIRDYELSYSEGNRYFEDYIPTSDVTFITAWNTAYNVTFSSEEGYIRGKVSQTSHTFSIEANTKIGDNNLVTCSTHNKKIFKGWHLKGDEKTLYVTGTPNTAANEKRITDFVVDKDTEFVAIWKDAYLITFVTEDGYFSYDSKKKQTTVNVEAGTKFINSTSYYPGNNPGHVFAGWKLEGDSTNVIYQKQYSDDEGIDKSISDLDISEDLTFYAVWDESYQITYYSEGGYLSGSSTSKNRLVNLRKGLSINSNFSYGYNRPNYEFVGWKIEGDASDTLYVKEEKDAINGAVCIRNYIPNTDTTFNLVWISHNNVTFHSEEGYIGGSKYQKNNEVAYVTGEKINSIPSEARPFGREGYTAVGYTIDGDETGTLYVENVGEYVGQENVKSIYDYVVNDNVTFVVQWSDGYDVTFVSETGYLNGKESDKQMIVSVSTGNKIKTIPSPVRDDYLFKGFIEKDSVDNYDNPVIYVLNSNEAVDGKIYIGDYEVTKNVTFEALWEKDFAKLLKAAKDNAKTQLDEYAESKKLADATEAETKTYKEAVSAGKKIIDTAAVEDEIDSKLAEAKGKIDDVIVSIKVARQKAEDEKNNQGKNNETEKTTTAPGSSNNNTQPKTTQSTKKPKPVVKKKQTIKAKSKKLYYSDKAVSLGVKTTGNGKLTFKSSNPKVIKIAKNGKVKTVGLGKATITIKAAGTSKYKPATKKITVTVVCAKQVIKSNIQWGNRVKLSWVKDKTVDGYEVQFSIDKKFNENKTIHNFFKKNVNSTLIKPNGNYTRTYYVRVRSYRIVKGKKVFNDWSKTCTVNLN